MSRTILRLIFTWPRRDHCTNTRQSLLNNILILVWYCVHTCRNYHYHYYYYHRHHHSSFCLITSAAHSSTLLYILVLLQSLIVCARRSCGYNSLKNNLRNAFFFQFFYTYIYLPAAAAAKKCYLFEAIITVTRKMSINLLYTLVVTYSYLLNFYIMRFRRYTIILIYSIITYAHSYKLVYWHNSCTYLYESVKWYDRYDIK